MKKVIIPVSGGNMPPLVMMGAQPTKQMTTNPVQPILLKTSNPVTSSSKVNIQPATTDHISSPSKISAQPLLLQMSSNSNNMSNMRLVQTSTGKKLLLTNVVNASKPSTSRQVLLVPRNYSQPACISTQVALLSTESQPEFSPVVPSNVPRTVILKPTVTTEKSSLTTGQPIMLQVPGISQPIVVRQSSQASPVDIKKELHTSFPQMITVLSNSTATPTTTSTVTKPITSTAASSSPLMILNGGTTTFKVVGKPVPVKLNPKLQKIAPKAQFIAGTFSPQIPIPPLKSVEETHKMLSTSQIKNGISAKPPAYLNIQIKEEPKEAPADETVIVDGVSVKEEHGDPQKELEETFEAVSRPDTIFDVPIKEEPKDEQSELLARDEQLRQVLGVTNKIRLPIQPRFYIRTSEGKLVSISPEEAEALGLDHEDKVENNQKKLLKALTGVKSTTLQKAIGQEDLNSKMKSRERDVNILIPDDVNVKDFVSCHVPPGAEKTAALMRNLGSKRVGMNLKGILTPKSNTTIIGEFTENEHRFLRIRIETESQEQNVCDIAITPFNSFRCPFCTRDFKTKDHIISHIRIHTGERPYPCDVCGKRYRQRIDIIRHMRIHTGEKPFTCGFCNASFNQKSNLRSHMRIHTGERPVQCRVCGKGFSRNTHLKQHMKLHTGEKPFQCSVCFRPFRFKSGLQAHERIHSGLKPYACSLCGRTFTQIVGLIRHERTHVGEKPFRCQSCGKSFDNRENLKTHVMKHTSQRPFSCDLCDKTFTDQAALRCHRKKYHSNMLICVICLREDFKDRIELREHLRAHERENWQETPEGDLVPVIHKSSSQHVISIDDTMENLIDNSEFDVTEGALTLQSEGAEEIQVEVELDPDDPMENEDNTLDDDDDSEYEEHELQIEEADPLA